MAGQHDAGSAFPLAELAPAPLLELHIELLGRRLDPLPSLVPLSVGDVFNLIESGHRVANVAGVFQRLLPLLRKGELARRELLAIGFVERAHAWISLLQVSGRNVWK